MKTQPKFYKSTFHYYKKIDGDTMIQIFNGRDMPCIGIVGRGNIYGKCSLLKDTTEIDQSEYQEMYDRVMSRINEVNNAPEKIEQPSTKEAV